MRAAIVIRSLLSPAGKPLPSACSWCCAITALAPADSPIRRGLRDALRDVLAVEAQLVGREGLVAVAQARRQLELADVVEHRADADVDHVVGIEAEAAAHQQRDDRRR